MVEVTAGLRSDDRVVVPVARATTLAGQ